MMPASYQSIARFALALRKRLLRQIAVFSTLAITALTPLGVNANDLSNPGFESGSIGPWESWGGLYVTTSPVRSGGRAAAISNNGGGGVSLAASAGVNYSLSAWGQTDGSNGSAFVFVKFFDADWNEVGQQRSTSGFAASWQQQSVSAVAPANAAWVQTGAWNSSGATFYLDDVSLTNDGGSNGGGGNGGGGSGGQLLNNTGFENGNVNDWQAWNSFSAVSNNARGGSWAASAPSYNGGGINVPVTGGTNYTWSAWGKRAGSGWAGLRLKFFDSNWNTIGNEQQSDSFGSGYSQRSIQATAPGNAAHMQIALWNSSNGTLYIDDISLTEGGDGGGGGSGGGGSNQDGNLISDGGFEAGNTSQWQAWSSFFAAASNARSGTYAAQAPNGNGAGSFVEVSGSTNYVLTGWGKTSGSGWAGLQVKFFDSSWNEVGTAASSGSFGSAWSEQVVNVTTPVTAVRIQASLWNSSGNTLYIDDVALREGGTGGNNGGGGGGNGGGGGTAGAQSGDPQITGTRYYVSPGGSGVSTGRGSPGSVNATVRKICDNSAGQIGGGDAIIFLDGEYLTSNFSLGLPVDGNQPGHGGQAIAMVNRNCAGPAYVHLLAENRYGAVIRNNVSYTDHSGGFDVRASSYIWIEGFRVVGVYDPAVGFEGGISFGYGSHHAVARHNQISYVGGGGITINRATHIRIENNEITGAAGWHPYCASGISFFEADNPSGFANDSRGYSNYILGNTVYGTRTRAGCDSDANASNGIASYDGNCIVLDQFAHHRYRQRTLVESNVCVDNGGGGIHMYNSGDADVLNNTIFASGQVSVEGGLSISCTNASVPSRDVRFANNLVHTWSGTPLTATDFGIGCLRNIEHRHNVFVNKNPLPQDVRGTSVALTTNAALLADCGSSWNLQSVSTGQVGWANPRTNGSASDFRLNASSLGRDRGSCSVTPQSGVDHQGAARVNGNLVDLGAFEY